MRTAISPRLAINTLLNIGGGKLSVPQPPRLGAGDLGCLELLLRG
jgi:hypothetical protein